jgi:hypothetical protein
MTGSVRRRNAVRGCRGVGTRPTRRRATPTDAGMRAQAEGSPRAVAAVAPRSRVGVFTTSNVVYRPIRNVFYGHRKQFPIAPKSHARGVHAEVRDVSDTIPLRYRFCVPQNNPRISASRDCASRMCVSRHARGPRPIAAGTVLDVTSYLSLPGRDPVPYACARRRGGRWFCAAPAAPCGPPRCPARLSSRLICGTTACRVILNK